MSKKLTLAIAGSSAIACKASASRAASARAPLRTCAMPRAKWRIAVGYGGSDCTAESERIASQSPKRTCVSSGATTNCCMNSSGACPIAARSARLAVCVAASSAIAREPVRPVVIVAKCQLCGT